MGRSCSMLTKKSTSLKATSCARRTLAVASGWHLRTLQGIQTRRRNEAVAATGVQLQHLGSTHLRRTKHFAQTVFEISGVTRPSSVAGQLFDGGAQVMVKRKKGDVNAVAVSMWCVQKFWECVAKTFWSLSFVDSGNFFLRCSKVHMNAEYTEFEDTMTHAREKWTHESYQLPSVCVVA